MFKQIVALFAFMAIVCLVPAGVARKAQGAEAGKLKGEGPLAKYVAKEDKTYGWTKRREGQLGSGKYVELILTSQTWKEIPWKHQLFLYVPAKMTTTEQALLWIDGGKWSDSLEKPATADEPVTGRAQMLAAVGDQLHCPVALLLQVPQQPMFGGLVEDEIISLTFVRFVATGDAEWPLLLPMVKSAVRGMDAAQEFAQKEWSLDIKNFTVTGASKRGWTTWLTSAVDARVTALAPMVIDMLNMAPQMKHQVESFGEFSEQLQDYTSKGLQKFLGTEPGTRLTSIVDPYNYRDQIDQPKLIILGTNDRYWPLDALNLYWDDLKGEKYILYVPNNGHGLRDYPRMIGTINALNQHVAGGKRLPKLDWKFEEADGQLVLSLNAGQKPAQVRVWTATSKTRDFREAKFTSHEIKPNSEHYVYKLPAPESGYAALFGEAQFNGESVPFYLSTNVRIVGQPAAAGK